jgi:hypothetical protein
MCAFEAGKGSYFAIDDSTPTLRDISAYVSNVDFSRDINAMESTTFTKDDRTYIIGLKGATLSISGFWDSTATTGPDEVLAEQFAKTVTSTFHYGPQGTTTGDVIYHGECICTNYSISSPVDGIVGYTADFQVTAAVTRGAWPIA